MAKQGEINYLMRIGEAGAKHAAGKPYSDVGCGSYLMQIGCLMSLLPQPPCRLLDAGCGTGWTSVLFARRGYDVVGVDISQDMIFHANMNKHRERVDNLHFVVCDYENMPFELEFECAVFFDSLHHAVAEVEALRAIHRALRQGGICVTSEPGTGHARKPEAHAAVRDFNVTERDMPPWRIIRAAKDVGFRKFRIYPHPLDLHRAHYYPTQGRSFLSRFASKFSMAHRIRAGLSTFRVLFSLKHQGITYMVK